MRVTLFKLKKPKRFSIPPRHHDPAMDDLHSRVDALKAELEAEDKTVTSEGTRQRIKSAWRTTDRRKQDNRTSSLRIFLIAGLLFGLFYLYFFTDLLIK